MVQRLTPREVQCVRLAGEGLSNKLIGLHLKIAPATVNNHLSNAYAKLGTSDRFRASEAVARDYPDVSRFPPIPIAAAIESPPSDRAPDTAVADAEVISSISWPLPRPDRRIWIRLLFVLCFAGLSATVVAGIVSFLAASVDVAAEKAPPGAIRTLR
jgi:DNA-binding CsgD family transcriptional regulator